MNKNDIDNHINRYADNSTLIVKEPNYFPLVSSHELNPLNLFLNTHPKPYHTSIYNSLGHSGHGLITVSCAIEHDFSEISPPSAIPHYGFANGNKPRTRNQKPWFFYSILV